MEILKVIQRYGHTTYTIAKEMDVKQSSISNMINGNPTIETLRKLAKAIGCTVPEFFIDELPDDFDLSAYRQPKPEAEAPASAPGVLVCPHCGAGISFTAVVTSVPKAAEPEKEEEKEGKE
jgi:plasmid maintenance system antidote protein VapI